MISVPLFCVCVAITFTVLFSEGACTVHSFSDSKNEKFVAVYNECLETHNIGPDDMPNTEFEFVSNFNDQCFSQCLMTKLGFLKNLQFDKEAIINDVENRFYGDDKRRVRGYINKCLDILDATIEDQGEEVTLANQCSLAAKYLYCTRLEAATDPSVVYRNIYFTADVKAMAISSE